MRTAKVGVLGGGQLGRMLALAGVPLGIEFRFFDPSVDAPAGKVADLVVGDYHKHDQLSRCFEGADVVTYEFENVPIATARFLSQRFPVRPSTLALQTAQDRLNEKQMFQELEIPVTPFASVDGRETLAAALQAVGTPAVLKTRRLGYDGKGQFLLSSPRDADAAWQALAGAPLILERFVTFEREVSILAVRALNGETVFYPLVENHHHRGILRWSIAPAADDGELQAAAEGYAKDLLESLDYVGVLAVEFFVAGGRLLANEIAPRVHNSGHWTIEGAATSQFANHLRAILGWPLGTTRATRRSGMVNLIGATPPLSTLLTQSGVHVHLYGKDPRPGRKLGHLTLCEDDGVDLERRLRGLASLADVDDSSD